MSRDLAAPLLAHLRQRVTTLAVGIRLDRKDGLAMGFTTVPRRTLIDGLIYDPKTAITPTSVETKISTGMDNSQFAGILSSSKIRDIDVLAGIYDFAKIQIFLFNYADLTMGRIRLVKGRLGEVVTDGNMGFQAEIRGLIQQANQTIIELTSAQCRVDVFADERCQLNRAAHTWVGTVSSIISPRVLRASDIIGVKPDDWFNFGEFNFLTGANASAPISDVKTWVSATGQVEFQIPPRLPVHLGDTFEIVTGCSRIFSRCKELENSINFQGEPYVLGPDFVLAISGRG